MSRRGVFVVDRPVTGIFHGGPAESLSVVLGQTPLGLRVGQLYDPQTGVPQHQNHGHQLFQGEGHAAILAA